MPAEICASIDQLTVDDIRDAAKSLLTSPIAIAVLGDAPKDQIPDPRTIEKILRSFLK